MEVDHSIEAITDCEPETTESEPVAAVVGIGNRLLRDDGVGPRVIDALENSIESSEQLRLVDAGTTGFLALEAMSGCERAIVVDAIQTGKPPGTLQEYQFKDGGFTDEIPQMTMHDISFAEALIYARDAYELPDDVRIIGVEPASLTTGLELTASVREAVPDILRRIATYEPTIESERVDEHQMAETQEVRHR